LGAFQNILNLSVAIRRSPSVEEKEKTRLLFGDGGLAYSGLPESLHNNQALFESALHEKDLTTSPAFRG
jgi:hypothetical protein